MAPLGVEVVVILCVVIRATAASISAKPLPDGFSLEDLEPNKYFSYGIVPDQLNTEMTISFYDISVTTNSCDVFSVEIQSDGYFKHDFNRLAILCDADSLQTFTASSMRGFHIIVRTGSGAVSGGLKATFQSDGGTRITSEVLYG